MVETLTDLASQCRLLHEVVPVQQQVVVVQHRAPLLGLDVTAEQLAQLFFPVGAPRKSVVEHHLEAFGAVDAARVDRQAGGLARKALLLP